MAEETDGVAAAPRSIELRRRIVQARALTRQSDSPAARALDDAVELVEIFFDLIGVTPNGRSKALSSYLIADERSRLAGLLDRVIEGELGADAMTRATAELHTWLVAVLTDIRDRAPNVVQRNDDLRAALDRLDDRLYVTRQAYRAESKAAEASESVTKAQEAAGDAATSALGGEFARYATSESLAALVWSVGAIVVLVVVSVLSIRLLGRAVDRSWSAQLPRLAATLPLVGVGVYAARVAAHHRATAHWARTNAVQLKTIDAYADILGPERGEELRLEFGRRVFSPAVRGEPAATPALVDAAAVLQPAAEVLKATADVVKSAKK